MSAHRGRQLANATTALIVVAVLAVLYSLYFARAFLVPIAFALLLDFLLSPLVRLLGKARIPTPAGAAIVVLTLVGSIGFGAYQLGGTAQRFLDEAPQGIARAQAQIGKLLRPLARVSANAEKVAAVAGAPAPGKQPAQVVVVGPSMATRLAGTTQRFLGALLQILMLLFFLLAGGDLFLEKTISLLPLLTDKKKAVRIARDIESSVSTYLIANLGLNIVEGAIVGVALWAIGLPNALLWSLIVVAMEFIPFVGAIIMVGLLSLASLASFTDLPHILMVPGVYLIANFVQGNVVSTMVLGKRLALNSVALFVGLAFWFWIWGLPGAFIGVPLMSVFKICCDHIDSLAPFGELLGARADPKRPLTPSETIAV
ncbi:AI-2E family transporter [Gemmatimonas groenlandica]|uniref:AI-2E family transporter n=1 Tax=Gemmatimonas groenlandica TaxID=2732249 RepID=A0A6M4IUN0_9BACT|nr:AI-2E family transporter [Gemmatimonas groenlandica]QJR37895.1 AI-2E family transporter [Gemmatimonas groenlandica]